MKNLQVDDRNIVLASTSATRSRLLAAAGIRFIQRAVPVDEALVRDALRAEGTPPQDAAVALASLKGERVAATAADHEIVLAGDQLLVTADGAWPGKALSLDALKRQIEALAGATHVLHTAAVLFRGGSRIWHHVESPRVTLRPLSKTFIDRYVEAAGEALLGCVGGYQVEGLGVHVIARVDGDMHAVQGLPLLPVIAALRTQGVLIDD